MREDWDKAVAFVLRMEGGDQVENNPNDPGGLTRFGISQKAYPSVDIKNLTVEQAREIYHRDYWLPCSCDDLPTPFAIAVFDTAVNQGVGHAKRLLQIALGVEVDGRIGPRTLAAASKVDSHLIKIFLAQRQAEYARLMAKNQVLLKFAIDWSFRVIALAELLLKREIPPL